MKARNNSKKIYILGAGSMAKETLDIYNDLDESQLVAGLLEENSQRIGTNILKIPIFELSNINEIIKDNIFIGAIGSPMRKIMIEKLEGLGADFDTLIHPSIITGNDVHIGKGSIICAGNILTCNIKIGSHSIVNIGCTISHDVSIGNFTSIAPGVKIGGKVSIGDSSWIGIGTTIINDVKIGNNVFLGGGSVVVNSIPSNSLAYGVPAKVIRKLTEKDWEAII